MKKGDVHMQSYKERLQHFIDLRQTMEGTINAMIKLSLTEVSEREHKLVFAYCPQAWMMNPAGHTHGGILSAVLDIAMGAAAYTFSQAAFTPTIQLSVNFVKSSSASQLLCVEAICDHIGSRMIQTRAQITNSSAEVIASAIGSYAVNTKR